MFRSPNPRRVHVRIIQHILALLDLVQHAWAQQAVVERDVFVPRDELGRWVDLAVAHVRPELQVKRPLTVEIRAAEVLQDHVNDRGVLGQLGQLGQRQADVGRRTVVSLRLVSPDGPDDVDGVRPVPRIWPNVPLQNRAMQ